MLQPVLGPLRRPGVSWRRIVTSGRTFVAWLAPLALAGCPQLMEDEFEVGSASQPGTANGGAGAAVGSAGASGSGTGNGAASSGAGGGSGRAGSGNGGSASASNNNGGSSPGPAGTGGTNQTVPAVATCSDGAMNGGETGVDCGGSCEPCGCDGTFDEPELLTGFGLDPKLWGPMPSIDNGTLYFSRQDENQVENIYQATRDDRGTSFSLATALPVVNSSTAPDGTPFLTPDGLSFYLFSTRTGGVGDRDLYISTRNTTADDFSTPVLVGNVNSISLEYLPWLAPDRLSLYFVSNRGGGQGSSDIWVARRGVLTDQWGVPSNVSELNTSVRDEGITLSRDGLTAIFASNRDGGEGNVDLWLALRSSVDVPFSEPVNLTEVNSAGDDVDPHLSNDGHELFFSSGRSGEQLLYRAWRDCP
jgi:WD40 repeat protein